MKFRNEVTLAPLRLEFACRILCARLAAGKDPTELQFNLKYYLELADKLIKTHNDDVTNESLKSEQG